MLSYSNEALGQVVRSLRESKGKTQEELGREAGYRAGAGVSISRLENGLLAPSADRLAGIATALGLSLESLEARASEQTTANGSGTASGGANSGKKQSGAAGDNKNPPSSKELKARAKKIQQEVDDRTRILTDLTKEFNKQHDRARDEFFMRFVEIAERVKGAPGPDPTQLQDDEDADAESVAAFRLDANANNVQNLLAGGAGGAAAGAVVGGAAAYGAFVAVASFGTASTGAVISGLSGIAATNAALAVLGGGTLAAGGAGIAGGTMVLAGIVAAPALILAAGGLVWMVKRNRKQQQEFAEKLDVAEAELALTRPGVKALEDILPRATQALDYIATHAGHALTRWEADLGEGPRTWGSLGHDGQRRYQDFIDIAAAQLAIVTINVQGLLTTSGSERDSLVQLADEVLTQAQAAVNAHV